jgi:hypothetical protein
MRTLLLSLLILGVCPHAVSQESSSLGFESKKFHYHWDRLIPLDFSVDGLQVKTIFFNNRELNRGVLKGAQFGTRARVEVENTSDKPKNPGFAVAVFDEKDNLLGVASGGTKIGVLKPGKTDAFDLNITQVKERLQRGSYFVISVELVN